MLMLSQIMNSPFLSLNNIYRFSNTHLIERESTAEHTVLMQLISLYFYNMYPGININDICMRCLYHDLDESVMADIPRSVKYASPDTYRVFEEVTNKLLKDNKISDEIINKITKSKHDNTIEGCFVQVIDVMQCCFKLLSEHRMQNNSAMEFRLYNAIETYESCINEYYEFYKSHEGIPEDYLQCKYRFCDILHDLKVSI